MLVHAPASGARTHTQVKFCKSNAQCPSPPLRRPPFTCFIATETSRSLRAQHDQRRAADLIMGAAPRTSPTPDHIARSFVSVYYRVAEKLPNRLGEFYGTTSEINHGKNFCATGPQIARLAERLPIAGAVTSVASLSVQQTPNAAYVVVVVGTFEKLDAKLPFTQTFVLEKQVDSHDQHFFCTNDIFTPVNLSTEITFVEHPKSDAGPVSVDSQVAQSASSGDIAPAAVPSASSVVPVKNHPSVDSVSQVRDPSEEVSKPLHDVGTASASASLSDSAVNGPINLSSTDPTPISEDVSPSKQVHENVSAAEELAAEKSEVLPTNLEDTSISSSLIANRESESQQRTLPSVAVPPVKKTWASVVSSKDVLTNGPVPTVNISEAPAPVIDNELLEEMAVPTEADTKNGQATANSRPAGLPNGHRPSHHVNRGSHVRSFGPSAVVQLSALDASQLQDPRALCNLLREEFATYGHNLRNVEVKAQKGIAFVEYESLEGVRAAVAAWAGGPREEGAFAGVALQVTEKRPSHGARRPGSVRTGRGGARGVRRMRPTSTPLS